MGLIMGTVAAVISALSAFVRMIATIITGQREKQLIEAGKQEGVQESQKTIQDLNNQSMNVQKDITNAAQNAPKTDEDVLKRLHDETA